MAFRATQNYWRGIVMRLGENRTIATSSAPKMAYAPTASDLMHDAPQQKQKVKGAVVHMYVALGMIMISLSLGIHTAKQQLLHCPNVLVSKKKRETLPEVGDPDYVTHKSSEFVNKSLFRRVALIQNSDKDRVITDSVRGDTFNHPRHAETLKSVGVEPSGL